MKLIEPQRPSVLTPACAPGLHVANAHAYVVGLAAVRALKPINQEESVQSIRTRVAGSRGVQLARYATADQGTSGFVAQTSGMATTARWGGKASGTPPRERPV